MGSLTTGAGASDKAKERAKALQRAAIERANREREEREAVGIDKLEYDIGHLKNTISNSKMDLKKSRGNIMIQKKIELAEESLADKLSQMKKLKEEEVLNE